MTSSHGHPDPALVLRSPIDPIEVLRRCGKTFHAASLMLPPRVRRELAVLYAFCRVVDDCGDLAGVGVASRPHELLDEIEACLGGESASSPIVSAFLDLADRHAVPVSHARELVEGVRSDLSLVRIASEDELIRYAYRVASTVGLMMCRVLGVEREGDPFAIDLGIAMQLTNISRDVREDALNNRVYLPAAWVPAERVLEIARAGSSDPSVEEAVERALMLADRYYDSASLGMGYLRGAIRPGIRAAATNYRAIGSVIRRDPARALRGRVATSRRGKLLRSAVAVGTAVHEHFFRLRGPKHDSELHLPLATLSASTIPAT